MGGKVRPIDSYMGVSKGRNTFRINQILICPFFKWLQFFFSISHAWLTSDGVLPEPVFTLIGQITLAIYLLFFITAAMAVILAVNQITGLYNALFITLYSFQADQICT